MNSTRETKMYMSAQ